MSIIAIWASSRRSRDVISGRAFWRIAAQAPKVLPEGRKSAPCNGGNVMGLSVMILGLVLFLGVHTLTTQRALRARLIASTGEGGYKIGYSLVSAAGLALIVWGFAKYRATGWIDVWYSADGDEAPHGGADAARRHSGGGLLHPRPHLHHAEASDADRHQAVGGGASARQWRPRLDHPVRLVPGMGGVRPDLAEASHRCGRDRRSRSAVSATT